MKFQRIAPVSGVLTVAGLVLVTAQAGAAPSADSLPALLAWEKCGPQGTCVSSETHRRCVEWWATLSNGARVTACIDYPVE